MTLSVPGPEHPSVSVVNSAEAVFTKSAVWKKFVLNFYCIAMKKKCTAKMRYGQQFYDFDEGIMTYTAPGQVPSLDVENEVTSEGYMLFFILTSFRDIPWPNRSKTMDFSRMLSMKGSTCPKEKKK
jgi:hypothetical protein